MEILDTTRAHGRKTPDLLYCQLTHADRAALALALTLARRLSRPDPRSGVQWFREACVAIRQQLPPAERNPINFFVPLDLTRDEYATVTRALRQAVTYLAAAAQRNAHSLRKASVQAHRADTFRRQLHACTRMLRQMTAVQ